MGGRIDNSANDGRRPYVFRLHGQNMHLIGDLLPKADETPRFSQLYIYDTDNEVVNRMRNARAQDRPDLLSRVFKIKLKALMKDITKEFLFEHKLTNEALIDSVVCAEIPDQDSNPRLYEEVKTFMIHGHCGLDRKNSPCMVKSRCSTHFPKKFTDMTSFDEDGYCKYRRRDSGHFIEKSGIKLDNRFVVPYNPTLLLRYQTHINVEFCNQSRSIKYLFKYVSKGHDKVTAALCNPDSAESSEENCDEIKTYLDCRYISPCEAVWRIF
ncbi:putative transmembrane protein [Senna tora]|uniref:Putative transmembrane protein n=1 Tax=Senna tora TaxID=362788 RepID=A0A834X0P8_9FABA|nr:putative transmembrane protein [Senna tora]